jgi:hypothetical protein
MNHYFSISARIPLDIFLAFINLQPRLVSEAILAIPTPTINPACRKAGLFFDRSADDSFPDHLMINVSLFSQP